MFTKQNYSLVDENKCVTPSHGVHVGGRWGGCPWPAQPYSEEEMGRGCMPAAPCVGCGDGGKLDAGS